MPSCRPRRTRKDRLVYLILPERRLVLAETQAPQPDHNVHDDAPTRRSGTFLSLAGWAHCAKRNHTYYGGGFSGILKVRAAEKPLKSPLQEGPIRRM